MNTQQEAQYRVNLKRELRAKGIKVNSSESTATLEALLSGESVVNPVNQACVMFNLIERNTTKTFVNVKIKAKEDGAFLLADIIEGLLEETDFSNSQACLSLCASQIATQIQADLNRFDCVTIILTLMDEQIINDLHTMSYNLVNLINLGDFNGLTLYRQNTQNIGVRYVIGNSDFMRR